MKAIHNQPLRLCLYSRAVNYTQRYKKWKQFTTCRATKTQCWVLWTIHKDTKNESNSQQELRRTMKVQGCELYTKIQKMKAIHNTHFAPFHTNAAVNYTQRYKKWKQFTTRGAITKKVYELWTIHKDTKNESNSQPMILEILPARCCELYTKIQKMKAIHNAFVGHRMMYLLWTIHKDTRIISINLVKYAAMLLGNRFR